MCIVAAMDKSPSSFDLCTTCAVCITMANCVHRKRWPDTKRSTVVDRWHICHSIVATIILAHTAAHAAFHQTNSTKANHTDSLDGPDLFVQCGN